MQRTRYLHRPLIYEKSCFYCIVFSILIACKKKSGADTDVQLRIWNATSGTVFNCIINPGGTSGNYNYGRIGLDSFSSYKSFTGAYSYGYVSLTLNITAYVIQPIDYVGEKPLAAGKYTYKITLSSPNRIETTLIKD